MEQKKEDTQNIFVNFRVATYEVAFSRVRVVFECLVSKLSMH